MVPDETRCNGIRMAGCPTQAGFWLEWDVDKGRPVREGSVIPTGAGANATAQWRNLLFLGSSPASSSVTEITSRRLRPCLQYGTHVSSLPSSVIPAGPNCRSAAAGRTRLRRRTPRHAPQGRQLFLVPRLEDQRQIRPRRHGDLVHDLPSRANPRRHDDAQPAHAQGSTLLHLPREHPGHASESPGRKTTLRRLPRLPHQRSPPVAARRSRRVPVRALPRPQPALRSPLRTSPQFLAY